MPDSPELSSALNQAVDEGRKFLTRVESLAGNMTAELARLEQASREWAAERQTLNQQAGQLREQVESLNGSLSSVRDTVRKLEQERLQLSADRDQIHQAREALQRELGDARDKLQAAERDTARVQAELATSAAELGKVREQVAMVSKDRDALQADQIQWGLDREQLLAEQGRLKERASALEADLASGRQDFEALQARHTELIEQSNKLAADWASRRQALAAEIAAQNEEMEQVRKSLQASQERERRVVPAPVAAPASAMTADLSHVVNSRLNTLVGFSSVLMDERANPLTAEERREYVKYLHDSAIKLGDAIRTLSGNRPASAESRLPIVDAERRPPDILVADNDQASRQRIEPFLKRAGYEVVYVDNGPRALEKASHLQPLAILIDASLPPSGAPTLVRELRKDPRTREIPMVLLASSSGPPIAIADCEVLTKPIDRQQLVQLMVRFDLMADSKRARKMPTNVLVIDDDAQAVSLVRAVLKPFNVRVTAVDNGRSGIEQALRNKPDMVILDLLMPDTDGFEVVTSLRRDKEMSRVPILIHTAKPLTAEDRQRLDGKVESIVDKAEFQPERFLELLLKRGERRKRAA
ncbi:MAG TPA: response regulator [Candidatus Acidoferrum sp.]|nr:response regulator [Candidatus Acidoferrum sp.]